MSKLPESLQNLINAFTRLPGVGEANATRFSLFIIKQDDVFISELSDAIKDIKELTQVCQQCFNYSMEDFCQICSNHTRNKNVICVVPTIKELLAFENSDNYHGVYHVLQGLIAPMEGVRPEDIRIQGLLERVEKEIPEEIIFALGSSVTSIATSLYLTKILKPLGIKLSKIAYGVQVGAEVSAADPLTIKEALDNRREV